MLPPVHLLVEVDAAKAADGSHQPKGVKDPVQLNFVLKKGSLENLLVKIRESKD
jgi:hypothetical protein